MATQTYTLNGQIYTTTGAVPVGGTKISDSSGSYQQVPSYSPARGTGNNSAGTVGYNPTTGLYGTNPNNPVVSSENATSIYKALGNDINTFSNSAGLTSANDKATKLLEDRMNQMKSDYESDIGGIKTAYEEANRIQTDRQNKDYAGRATNLITSGGGFLGTTQSQQGVLQNLTNTFTNEKNALMSKRDAALQAARNAYDEKAFDYAMEQLKLAKDTEQEIYNRQKDYADQSLAIAREDRAKKEFDMGIADKKINSYASLSDEQFAKINPAEIAQLDQSYYPGYTNQARIVAKKALDIKTNKDAVALDSDILDMRLKMPLGQKFVLNGQTYTGLKQADVSGGGTAAERKDALFNKVSEILSGKLNAEGSQLYTIPGTKGVPYIDSDGYLTPEGWKYAVTNFGLEANDLITRYGHLFNPDYLSNYKMSEVQKNLIRKQL